MLETAMIIRDFDPAKDKAAALAFIMGSQHYEHRFEPDRRLDAEVAEEFLPEILKRVAAQRGRISAVSVAGNRRHSIGLNLRMEYYPSGKDRD
jgi:hypothetical protein